MLELMFDFSVDFKCFFRVFFFIKMFFIIFEVFVINSFCIFKFVILVLSEKGEGIRIFFEKEEVEN